MEQRICKQCGKTFFYHGHKSGDHTKYCSNECYAEMKRESNLRTYHKYKDEYNASRQNYFLKYNQKREHEADERRRQWLGNNVPDGFEYLGDWVGGNTEVSFKCLRHGVVVRRTIDAVRQNGAIRCEICKEEYYNSRRVYGSMEEWRAAQAKQKEQRKQERLESRKRVVVCDVCGMKFITYNLQQKRCSLECTQLLKNRDKRLTQANIVDNNITLPRLYERDGGFCYICGLKCSWEDKAVRGDGTFICGPTYPTIDHVFPLAKGGKHSWENVKLAHWVCNIRKSDEITDGVADGTEVITSGRILPKKTLQYDFEGNLIHVYPSTGEAEKVTGIKRKGIQKCARGEAPSYHGYVWRYA